MSNFLEYLNDFEDKFNKPIIEKKEEKKIVKKEVKKVEKKEIKKEKDKVKPKKIIKNSIKESYQHAVNILNGISNDLEKNNIENKSQKSAIQISSVQSHAADLL